MASLVFSVLDLQVVSGLADEPAIQDVQGEMSYAELLHESASVAGAMTNLGITEGTAIRLDVLPGREQVVAVLACARLGAVPADDADHRLAGDPPVLHTIDTEVPWDLLIRAGRTDPAPAPARDAEGYEERVRGAYPDVFGTLEAGGTIRL